MSKKAVTRRPRKRAGKAAATRKAPRATVAPASAAPPSVGRAAATPIRATGAALERPVDLPPAEEAELPADLAFVTPEVDHAARIRPAEPERPLPGERRAIFFDVENTSHAPHVERVMRHLALDRLRARTDFVAVGNWRVIGHDIARLLSRHGAHLVHSAPATGVRDWSDLRIAVTAGVWLGTARPGDRIQIVSDDRAFDAVGDVATALGIEFQRLSYRILAGAPAAEPVAAAPAAPARNRGRHRRSHGRTAPPAAAAARALAEARPSAPPLAAAASAEPHTAPHDEIIHVARELAQQSQGRAVLIDTLARELKRRGFARTAGSPRLITRLRRIRELSVSPSGMITLLGEAAAPALAAPALPDVAEEAAAPDEAPVIEAADAAPAGPPAGASGARRGSRRRRRGGRGRRPAA